MKEAVVLGDYFPEGSREWMRLLAEHAIVRNFPEEDHLKMLHEINAHFFHQYVERLEFNMHDLKFISGEEHCINNSASDDIIE